MFETYCGKMLQSQQPPTVQNVNKKDTIFYVLMRMKNQ